MSALEQLCRTSIIRDEWIAALSLDLTETERFDLVRTALGTVEGADYAGRARDVQSASESAHAEAENGYESARGYLTRTLTELAEARDIATKAGGLDEAIAILKAEVGSTEEGLTRQIAVAREGLTSRRVRLSGIARALAEARELAQQRGELASPVFGTRKTELGVALISAQEECERARAALAKAQAEFAVEQQANDLGASLIALLEHGARVGLHDGHCPLCDALRTQLEYEQGISTARTRLAELGSGIEAARQNLAEKDLALNSATAILEQAQRLLADLVSVESSLRAREEFCASLFDEFGLDHSLSTNPDGLERVALLERSRLVDLERSVLTLEASQSIERVKELESRVTTLRQEAEAAADYLAKAQAAVATARNIDRAVRRTNAEIIDERLAAINPLLNELYQRLRPHAEWRNIEYSIRGDVRRYLSLKVGDNLNPQFVFSSGQRRAAGLAFLLSVHLSRPWCRWQTLVLDDPVQHIDDYRALHLVEVLAALRRSDRQVICTVEDKSLADLLCRRLLSTSELPGRRIDLDLGTGGAGLVTRRTEIPPMPTGVLSRAFGSGAGK